jgi:membrane glycosyltransferase
MVPAILAPFLISITSRPTSNAGTPLLFATDSELSRPSIVDAQRAIFAAWTGQGTQDAGLITVRTAQHVTA